MIDDRKTDQSPVPRPFRETMLLRSAAKGQWPVRCQTALGKNIGAMDLLGKNRMKKLRSRRKLGINERPLRGRTKRQAITRLSYSGEDSQSARSRASN